MTLNTQPGLQSQVDSIFARYAELEFAVLVGSRVSGHARPESDWDIAMRLELYEAECQRIAADCEAMYQFALDFLRRPIS